ncbi:MAG TPA: O-antigen ligase family protein [Chthoniobacterales bacterium]|jgi:O-antigen ligase|nr:O-antigen ligase family protein [Chthoniobacterales bacterium]
MFPTESPPKRKALAYAIPVLVILAPALGGSTALWAKAIMAIATGLLFILLPPERTLRPLHIIALVILALALTAFLPANWFGYPPWRTDLAKLGAQLPWTISSQPWLTFESICLLAIGLGWAYYLVVADWDSDLREAAVATFCIGILVLAASMSIAFALQKRVPFWPVVGGFGFFQNRNETGNVFALGGIMIYAVGMQRWQEGRRNWWIWLISVCLVFWALIINSSRAGIVLFFAGTLAWHLWWLSTSKKKRLPALLLIALVLLGGVLAWNGSAVLGRFTRETADFFSLSRNGRLAIYRDSFEFLKQSPGLGIGLGNFRSLFSSQRHFFISTTESIHPESDWFWVTIEMGLPVLLLLLAGVVIWLRGCLPFRAGTHRRIRVAAMICGLLFVFHGFLDVPGHRLGALWPALFLCSIGISPQLKFDQSRTIQFLFRVVGAVFIVFGLWWIASVFDLKTPPTTSTEDRLLEELELANNTGNYERAVRLADSGLAIAPLNWPFYYQRGLASAALYHPRPEAERDFAIARYLLPIWPDLALKEGLIWLNVGEEDLAFSVWEESIRRWPANAAELYDQIFGAVRGNVELRDRWRQLGHIDVQCLLILLRHSQHLEFELELERLFSKDPNLGSLSAAELTTLFETWFDQGDQLALAETLMRHPEWQKLAWQQLANALANYGDYHPAYDTAHQFVQRPRLPEINSDDSTEVLIQRSRASGNIDNDGIAVVVSEMKLEDFDSALSNLKNFATNAKVPASVYFLESEVWARKGEWQKAWAAMVKYQNAIHK